MPRLQSISGVVVRQTGTLDSVATHLRGHSKAPAERALNCSKAKFIGSWENGSIVALAQDTKDDISLNLGF